MAKLERGFAEGSASLNEEFLDAAREAAAPNGDPLLALWSRRAGDGERSPRCPIGKGGSALRFDKTKKTKNPDRDLAR